MGSAGGRGGPGGTKGRGPTIAEQMGALGLSRVQCELVGRKQDRRKRHCGNKCGKKVLHSPPQMPSYWWSGSKTERKGKNTLL